MMKLTAVVAMFVVALATSAFSWPWTHKSLRVDPPKMLYWGNARLGIGNDAFYCQVLADSEIVEADERTKAYIETLPCAASFTGDWLRYTLIGVTWECPSKPPNTCGLLDNTIYGYMESVPDEALLHHKKEGSYSCQDKTISWAAGDAIDVSHGPELCRGYGKRPLGTHLLVNPKHSWTKEAVKRFSRIRLEQGYTWARIDETYLTFQVFEANAKDVLEYPRGNVATLWNDTAKLLKTQVGVKGWKATCPSQHDFWLDRPMKLNRAGRCAAAENFPHGRGLIPNLKRETFAQLKARLGYKLQNAEAWDDNPANDNLVPNNILYALRYESVARNVVGAAQMVRRAKSRPNLYWLMDCGGTPVSYGAALQEAVGSEGDKLFCTEHWGLYRNPSTGLKPPWFR